MREGATARRKPAMFTARSTEEGKVSSRAKHQTTIASIVSFVSEEIKLREISDEFQSQKAPTSHETSQLDRRRRLALTVDFVGHFTVLVACVVSWFTIPASLPSPKTGVPTTTGVMQKTSDNSLSSPGRPARLSAGRAKLVGRLAADLA
ncbi:hypothetical protein ACOMHN_049973 [Nucella lapillus]